MSKGRLKAIVDANSLLRFAKSNADVTLKYKPLQVEPWSDLRLAVMFDAA